jgi:hypothetical protein
LGNIANLDEFRIELNTKIGVDQRRYNTPTVSHVAAIWEEGSDTAKQFEKSIMVCGHNIAKHITYVMTLFRIHCFSLVVRLVGTSEYCMQTKAIPLKVCVFICVCDSVYHSFFSQLLPK